MFQLITDDGGGELCPLDPIVLLRVLPATCCFWTLCIKNYFMSSYQDENCPLVMSSGATLCQVYANKTPHFRIPIKRGRKPSSRECQLRFTCALVFCTPTMVSMASKALCTYRRRPTGTTWCQSLKHPGRDTPEIKAAASRRRINWIPRPLQFRGLNTATTVLAAVLASIGTLSGGWGPFAFPTSSQDDAISTTTTSRGVNDCFMTTWLRPLCKPTIPKKTFDIALVPPPS